MKMTDILFFEPHLDERIWGGDHLRHLYNALSSTQPIGEAWLISGMKNASSTIKNGKYAGKTLRDCFRENPDYFGFSESPEFPLLVKWIDAQAKLSVQVHPDDAKAKKMENSRGKTECWYVTEAGPNSYLILGHTANTKSELAEMIQIGDYDNLLRKVKIQKGDFVYIPAGLLHAIGDHVRLVEIQQASDVTYRVYDYDREDTFGRKRPLHLQQALAVTTVPSPSISIINYSNSQGIVRLVTSPFFTVEKWTISSSLLWTNKEKSTSLFVVLEGEGTVQQLPFKKGDAFIIPWKVDAVQMKGKASLLHAFKLRNER